MDFTTCKTILRGCKGGKFRYDSVIVFRTFKIVVEKIVAKRKGNWAQILLDFDFRTITWDLNRFQSILLLFSSLSLFSDHANYPCSVSTVLQQQYVTVLCDTFFVNLVTLKEWTPLQWRAVHNISRISSLSPTSKQSIMLYILKFVNMIPAGYEECWFQNCSSFCHSSTTAVLLFIEIYQANTELLNENSGFLKTFISLVCYFDSYKIGSPVDQDMVRKGVTAKNIDANMLIPTTWSSKLVEKLVTFLMKVFRQNYTDGITIPVEHALFGLDYPSGHVQTLSLIVILCHLRAITTERAPSSKPAAQKTGDDGAKVLPKQNSSKPKEKAKLRDKVKQVRNALKLQDAVKKRKSPHFRVCESLYQSGQIRKIYWCLLNKCYNVRMLAFEVLSTFENVLNDEKSDQQSAWQSYIIEQGLVPLLELIACGFPITNSMEISASAQNRSIYFPEHTISLFAQTGLSTLAAVLAEDVVLQEKLILSLIHTKNVCIRGNIFAGLIYLAPKSVAISKLLIRSSTTEGGNAKSIFAEILAEVYVEESLHDLKNVVKIIYHFFQTRNRQVQVMVRKANEVDNQKKDIQKKDNSRVVKETLSLSTEILIRDKFNGSLVKMLCPDKKTLKAHSNRLLMLMESVGSKPDPKSKDASLSILPGHYHIWQEIFSHMIDDFVMDTTLTATGVAEILEFYEYSCKYELTHLCMRYTKELVKRLSSESFIQIFQCSIAMMTETGVQEGLSLSHKIDASAFNLKTFPSKLSLCCHCVRYFIERMSKVSTPQNMQRKIIISEALELYFQFLLIAQ